MRKKFRTHQPCITPLTNTTAVPSTTSIGADEEPMVDVAWTFSASAMEMKATNMLENDRMGKGPKTAFILNGRPIFFGYPRRGRRRG